MRLRPSVKRGSIASIHRVATDAMVSILLYSGASLLRHY